MLGKALSAVALAILPLVSAASITSQDYTWANVKIGGGGGFVPGIVFNPSEKGLAYIRTDIGGAYRLNSDDTWTPLLDSVGSDNWAYWGVDALATDPVDTDRLYLVCGVFMPKIQATDIVSQAVGAYTNSWDPNNGHILISTDRGDSWTASELPFKVRSFFFILSCTRLKYRIGGRKHAWTRTRRGILRYPTVSQYSTLLTVGLLI